MRKLYALAAVLVALAVTNVHAQNVSTNSGSGLNPTYADLATAITALNAATITGPVVITLNAAETAPAGGYVITATGTSGNTITIQGVNTGTAVVTASGAQTAGSRADAVFKIVGGDYITLQNFTMQENAANTTTTLASNNMTEWGVALLYASTTDGAQNNTIQNNIISLNRTYVNTFGIYSNTRHSATGPTLAAEVTSASGSNSFNKVYGNAISNVNFGIVFIGAGTTLAAIDDGNDIGGSSLATGNTITNWGAGAASGGYISLTGSNYCIFDNQQINDNVSFNTITSALVTNVVTTGGILKNYSVAQPTSGTITTTIINNTVTVTNNPTATGTGGTVAGVVNQGMATLLSTATMNINNNVVQNSFVGGSIEQTIGLQAIVNSSAAGTVNMNNNSVINCGISATSATAGNIFTIINTGAAGTLNMSSNLLKNMSTTAVGGQMQGISNQGAVVNAVNITNNHFGDATGGYFSCNVANTNLVFAILNSVSAATCALTITGNDIRGITYNVTASAGNTYISSSATTLSQNISNNTFTNLSLNTTGSVTFIANSVATPANGYKTINGNSIVTGFSKTAAGGTVTLYTDAGLSASTTASQNNNNNFSNITVTGATAIAGWLNNDGSNASSSLTKIISGNTFSNWTGGTGSVIAMQVNTGVNSGASSTITSNTFSNITGGGNVTGITLGATGSQTTVTVGSNSITGLSSTGTVTGNVTGISSGTAAATTNISTNTINTLSSTAASAAVIGVNVTAGNTVNVNGNFINTLSGSGGTSPLVKGIQIAAGTTVNVFKNKIYDLLESAAISSPGGAVSGIFLSGGTTVNTYNNLIGDLRAPSASLTDAIRGISVTSGAASSSFNVYFNTVYLNASSTGTDFGTAGVYHTASATSTTAALDLRNNIIVNLSTPSGAGITSALARSAALTYDNWALTSNRNLLAVSPTNAILNDGGTAYSSFSSYQTQVSTRDANSFTNEGFSYSTPNSFFISLTGSASTFLHLVQGITTRAESGGISVGSITDDYDGNTRNSLPDIGADEFSGVTPAPNLTNLTVPTAQCTSSSHVINVDVTTPAGTITSVVLNYAFNGVSQTPITMTNSGGNTYTGTIPSSVSASAAANAVVTWSVIATNSIPLSTTVIGSSYTDAFLTGATATATASTLTPCSGGNVTLSVNAPAASTYCASTHIDGCSDGVDIITRVQLNTLDKNTLNTCSTTSFAYSNFSGQTGTNTTTLNRGSNYTISVTVGNDATQYFGAWIDYNHNGVYEASEFLGASGSNAANNGTFSASFTVPNTALYGLTHMRVIGGNDLPLSAGQACGASSDTYGETQDYDVSIGSFSISWSDGTNVVGSSSSITVAPTVPTTYTGTLTTNGCTLTTNSVTVTPNPLPTAPNGTNSTQCGAGVPTASVSDPNGFTTPTFNWYTNASGGSALQSSTSTTYTTSIAGSGVHSYYVSVTNPTTGCESGRTQVNVTVTTAPTITVTPGTTATICLTNPVNLGASSAGAYTYTWSLTDYTGSGLSAPVTGANQAITPTAAGTYVYNVSGTDGSCTDTKTVTVTVNPNPAITSSTASQSTICEGASVTLTATSIASGPQSLPATYCTSTHTAGPSATITSVSFNGILNTGVTQGAPYYNTYPASGATTTSVFTGQTYTLTVSTSAGSVLSVWIDFNRNGVFEASEWFQPWNNATSGSVNILIPANASLGFTGMRIKSRNGGNPNSSTDACTTSFASGSTQDYTINIRQNNTGLTWQWNPGAINSISTTVSPITTTGYTVTATNTTTGCFTTSAPQTVTVNPKPTAPGGINSSQCGAGVPTASVSDPNGFTNPNFKWYTAATGGAIAQNSTSTTYTSNVSATITYYVAVVNPLTGCESNRTPVTISVSVAPTITVSPGATTNVCIGNNLSLNATSSGAYTYTWTANNYTTSGFTGATAGAAQTITPTAAGTYTYTVSGTDGFCSDVKTVVATVKALPVIDSVRATPAIICAGGNSSLRAYSSSTGPQSLPATYCVPIQSGTSVITDVTFNTLSNTGQNQVSPFYDIYPATGSTTTTLHTGQTYAINITSSAASVVSVWIDFNRNGVFEASEWFQPWLNATTGTMNILIPSDATLGITGMRIRTRAATSQNSSGDACTGFGSGSTQDYSVNIASTNVLTYTWNPGNLTGNPVVVSPAATTTYNVFATDATSCVSGTSQVTVTAGTALNATASAPQSTICAGTPTTLSVLATGGGLPYTYSWKNMSNNQVVGTTSSISVSPSVTTTYQVTVTDNCNTTTNDQVTITVNSLPTVSITPTGSLSLCTNNQSLTSTTDAASPTYQWKLNGNNIGSQTNASYTATNANVMGSYSLRVTDGVTGCSNTSAATSILFNSHPSTISVTPNSGGAVCLGGSQAITATATLQGPNPVNLLIENFNGPGPYNFTVVNGPSNTPITAWTRQTTIPYSYSNLIANFPGFDGTPFMLANSDAGGASGTTETYLVSNSFSTVGLTGATVSFQHFYRAYVDDNFAGVEYSTNGGASWSNVSAPLTGTNAPATSSNPNPTTTTYSAALPGAAIGQANVKVRIHYESVFGYYWGVDNIAVTGSPSVVKYAWSANPSSGAGLGVPEQTAATGNNSISVTPTVAGSYVYTVIASIPGTSCTTSNTVTVDVNAPAVAPTSLTSSSTICNGDNVTLTQTGGSLGTGGYWQWYNNSNFTSPVGGHLTSSDASLVVSPSTSKTYYVRAEGSAPCADASNPALVVTITVKQPSVAPTSLDATSTAICSGTQVTLTQTGGSLGTNAYWQWYSDANFTTTVGGHLGTNTASIGVTPSSTTTYYLRAEGATPCADAGDNTVNVTVTVGVGTVAPTSISATQNPICNGQSTTLTQAGGTLGSGATWHWYDDVTLTNEVFSTTSPSASFVASPTVTTTYYLRAEGGQAPCVTPTTVRSITITVNGSPTISYAGTPFCKTGVAFVTLTGQTGGTYSSDPGMSLNATTGYLYIGNSTVGAHTITYSVPSAGGCNSTGTTIITILPLPTLTLDTVQTICQNTAVAVLPYTVTGGNPTTYSIRSDVNNPMPNYVPVVNAPLSPGSTGTINVQVPANTPGGTYYFDLTVTSSNGCISPGKYVFGVTVASQPSTIISYAGTPFCGTSVGFVTRQGAAGGTYTSSSPNLSLDATSGTIYPAPSTPGSYVVTYTLVLAGCTYTATTPVTILPTPGITIGSTTKLCFSATAQTATLPYTATSNSPVSYSINADASSPMAGFTPVVDAPLTGSPISVAIPGGTLGGTYKFDLYVKSANGCSSVRYTFTVTVVSNTTTIAYNGGQPVCQTGTMFVTLSGASGGTYSSDVNLNINSTTGAIYPAASTLGTHTVSYSISTLGCSFTTTTNVTIVPLPKVTIGTIAPVCISANAQTASVPYTVTASTPVSYSITVGSSNPMPGYVAVTNATISNPISVGIPAGTSPGTYSFYLTLKSAGGCVSAKYTFFVTVKPVPTASISYPNSPYSTAVSGAAVTNSGTTGGTYSSTTGLSLNPSTGSIFPHQSTPGTYTVTYTVTTAANCTATTTTQVTIVAASTPRIVSTGTPGKGTTTKTAPVAAVEVGETITIAPNPVEHRVTVRVSNFSDPMQIRVTDATGKEILKGTKFTSSYGFDMSGYAQGIYMVEVVNEKTGTVTRKKLMKK